MTTIVIGYDEFVGAWVTDKLLKSGEKVFGISLDSVVPDTQAHRRNTFADHNNAHHLVHLGDFNAIDNSAYQTLPRGSRVLFLPDVNSVVNGKAQLLADTFAVIALCSAVKPRHLVVTTSAMVYYPHGHSSMKVNELVDHPISLEAATFRSVEMLLHGLSASQNLPCSIVRLFEVYGPLSDDHNTVSQLWKLMQHEKTIELKQFSNEIRDYVYVDDVAEGLLRILQHDATAYGLWSPEPEFSDVSEFPWCVYNLGTGVGTATESLFSILRKYTGHAVSTDGKFAPGSLKIVADTSKLSKQIGYTPHTSLGEGLDYLKSKGD